MVGMYMYGFDRLTPSKPGCPRGNIGLWTRGYVEAGRSATDSISEWLIQKGFHAVFTNALPYRTLAVRCGIGRIGNNGFCTMTTWAAICALAVLLRMHSLSPIGDLQ